MCLGYVSKDCTVNINLQLRTFWNVHPDVRTYTPYWKQEAHEPHRSIEKHFQLANTFAQSYNYTITLSTIAIENNHYLFLGNWMSWLAMSHFYPRMFCDKLVWSWSSGSGEEDFKMLSLYFRYYLPFIWTNLNAFNQLYPRMLCAKLSWLFKLVIFFGFISHWKRVWSI